MKKVSIIAIALLSALLSSTDVFAQKTSDDFNGYWFIQAQGGVAHTIGEAGFSDLLSPAAAFNFGYRFTPVWGLRAGLSGWQAKGALLPLDVYKYNYLQGNVDVVADICSMFSGYRMRRAVNPYLFAGIGVNGAFNNDEANAIAASFPADSYLWDGSKISPVGRFGIGMGIRLCDAVHFNIEANSNFLSDRFNSKRGSAVDWQFNLMAGFTFNIGLHKGRKASSSSTTYVPAPAPAPKPAPKPAPEPEPEPEPAPAPVVEKTPFSPVTENVFFLIGKYDVRESEMDKIAEVIRLMTADPELKVSVTGYADPQTGSSKRNMYLSKRRAESVVEILKAAGIDESRIVSSYKGSTESPYATPVENRVVVCLVSE